ncbi:MFS transporter [Phycicoccus sp. M110.8]|uniref:MFS transporter n=1 Tax=Phycicoccus sp. M110.8 TaxID=3075433 RepID=UPI0028FD58E9|nr:MFS transporter [Phycicoccus sp. M110.8]MDU0314917.1 MFS transporter [Phycicoccus sp. M110.8]HET8769097.1 MFS transporter [Pedococcus sp.]
MTGTDLDRTPLSTHRRAVAAAFGAQGLLFISLTTRLPRFQDQWGLSELAVSGLLLMVVLLAGLGSVLAELGAKRAGSATVLRGALVLAGLGLAVVALAPAEPVFVAGLAAYGLALGSIDATTNMQAVALEHRYGRTILPTFHGAWTLGGIAATLVAIAVSGLGMTAGLLPLAVLGVLAAAAPFLPHDVTPVEPAASGSVPWRRILLLGAAMVLFYMVDTAATTWGPVFLRSAHDAPDWLLPLATLPYLVASGASRLGGDAAVARWGSVPLLRAGAVVAALALAVIVFSPTWAVAVLGFTVLGGSVAVIAPLSFSAAAAVAGSGLDPEARRARVDAVIARFNQFNYVGGLLGAVLTGAVGAGSLRIGFAVPMVLVLLILPLAGAFRDA